jgi:hypothetical protein
MRKYFGILTTLIAALAICCNALALDIPEAKCNESVFKPCICASKAPKDIKYRPSFRTCGGNAAVILDNEWSKSFSVVLRNRLNQDRYPAFGYNGCTAEQAGGVSPPKKCSAYKCQRTIRTKNRYICCFGDKGNDKILSRASRMTIKFRDVPGSSEDPIARVCLPLFSPIYKMN